MRKAFVLFLLAFAMGCSKTSGDETVNDITGKWVRTEEYISPGGGGWWQPSNDATPVYIEFTTDGKVVSNHPVYSQLSQYTKRSDTLILSGNYNNSIREAQALLQKGKLTVGYACICGCGDRFVRANEK